MLPPIPAAQMVLHVRPLLSRISVGANLVFGIVVVGVVFCGRKPLARLEIRRRVNSLVNTCKVVALPKWTGPLEESMSVLLVRYDVLLLVCHGLCVLRCLAAELQQTGCVDSFLAVHYALSWWVVVSGSRPDSPYVHVTP